MALVTDRDLVIKALQIVSASLAAESEAEAIPMVRADLEVLSREDLLLVALVLATDIPWRRVPAAHRAKLRQRVDHSLLEISWVGS
jgi:hypothetical protein